MSELEGRVRLALDILERHNAGKITRQQAAVLFTALALPNLTEMLEKTP